MKYFTILTLYKQIPSCKIIWKGCLHWVTNTFCYSMHSVTICFAWIRKTQPGSEPFLKMNILAIVIMMMVPKYLCLGCFFSVNSFIYNSVAFIDLTKLFFSHLVYWTLCSCRKQLSLHALLCISAYLEGKQKATHSLSCPLSDRSCVHCSTTVFSLPQNLYQTVRILHRRGRMKDFPLFLLWNLAHFFPPLHFPTVMGIFISILGLADIPGSTRREVSLQQCPLQGQDIFIITSGKSHTSYTAANFL